MKIALFFAALTLPLALAGTLDTLRPVNLEGRKLRVTTTINIVSDLARVIGGNRVEVAELMGPGVDPHLYRASANDVRRMQQADLVLYNGLFLEGRMADLLEKLPRAIAVTDGIPRELLIKPPGGFEGQYTYDPHVWFDVSLWKLAAQHTREALIRVDPAGRSIYTANTQRYLSELDNLDSYIQNQMRRIPQNQRVLITAHDAFEYFGRRYTIEVRGLQGLSTAVEVGAKDVQDLAEVIANRRIPAIFVESSVPRRTVEAVVAAVRAKGQNLNIGGELFSDAAGRFGTPQGTYIGMMRHNTDTITKALLGR